MWRLRRRVAVPPHTPRAPDRRCSREPRGRRKFAPPGRVAMPCPHGRQRSQCKECGGGAVCEHGRQRSRCKDCGGGSICEHGRVRSRCKECGGGSFCPHGRDRSRCKDCGGRGVCEHGRRRSLCKQCGGGAGRPDVDRIDAAAIRKKQASGPARAAEGAAQTAWPADEDLEGLKDLEELTHLITKPDSPGFSPPHGEGVLCGLWLLSAVDVLPGLVPAAWSSLWQPLPPPPLTLPGSWPTLYRRPAAI